MQPWKLILIGLLLSIMGTVLPFLMVLHLLPSTYFFNFLSVICMIVGLALGLGGATQYVQRHKK
jgi:hypothetical protein